DQKEDAKASVVVRLKRGAELSKSSIAGIKGVVAGAVPGLRTYNVSVVDDEGRLLSQSAESGDTGRAEIESGIREQLEREMVAKVTSILEPVVGKGKVHANASIDIDFNTTEQTEETFNPTPPAVVSQQKMEERVGGASAESGIPGTRSNVGAEPPQQGGSIPERFRQNEITNYEVSKLVRHTVQPKGTIRRISVAVILDHKTQFSKGPDGKVTSTSQPRTPEELNSYRELVLAAVGFKKERGDTVTLDNVAFYSESKPEEAPPAPAWHVRYQPYYVPALKYTSYLLLFLLAYLFLLRPLRLRFLPSASVALAAPGAAALGAKDESVAQQLAVAQAPEEALAPAPEHPAIAGQAEEAPPRSEPAIDLESLDDQIERELLREVSMADTGGRKSAVIRKRLIERARSEPEMISQLVRSWIQERV
ncbi:MAG: flagellar M-ring protein FliF, partial [Acidobacteria bacterium]|nr:flagellar M-ring protein FliF [Acidobacteriota bacterium]